MCVLFVGGGGAGDGEGREWWRGETAGARKRLTSKWAQRGGEGGEGWLAGWILEIHNTDYIINPFMYRRPTLYPLQIAVDFLKSP
jgi:hypothetical protein